MLGGRELIRWPLDALASAGLDAVIVAKHDTLLPQLGVAVVYDGSATRHPLAGIVAALEHAAGRAVLVVAADLPFVTGALLAHIAAREGAVVVPEHDGRLHPLCALYRPSVLAVLRDALTAQAPLQRTVAQLRPGVVGADELARFGDPARLLFNVNRPQDLAAAEASLAPTRPPPS